MHFFANDAAALPANALAAATTLHVVLLVLRWHRSARRRVALLLPALLLCAAPWAASSAGWVAAGVAAHVALFLAGERGAPAARPVAPAAPVAAPASSAPRPDRPAGFVRVPLLAVLEETPDIRTFRMARPAGFDFRAGQYLVVRVPVDGRTVSRCYSISSAPESAGYLEISVKRQGLVSGLLHATARPGTTLEVRGPGGDFAFPENDALPLVLMAGGIGITPLRSMLLHALAAEPQRPVTLVYSVKGEHEVAFRDELVTLTRRHPQLHLAVAVSGGTTRPGLWPGRVDRRLLDSLVPDARNALFMICGPLPMIDAMRALALEAGADPARVRSEAFAAAAANASAPREPEPAGSTCGRAAAARLTLTRTGRTVPVAGRQSLLEAAEAAGSAIESVCRAGACGTCRTRLVSGEVEGEVDGGFVHPCVTYARADCALEA